MRAAIKGLLGFVKRHAETYSAAGRTVCRNCRALVEDCDELGTCEGSLARDALRDWEQRKPLDSDDRLIRELRFDFADRNTTCTVLRFIDSELLGPRDPATAPPARKHGSKLVDYDDAIENPALAEAARIACDTPLVRACNDALHVVAEQNGLEGCDEDCCMFPRCLAEGCPGEPASEVDHG